MLASLVGGLLVIFTKAAAALQKDLVFCVLSEQERVKCEVRIFQGFQSLNKIVFVDDHQDLARQTQEDQENDDRTFGSYFRTIRCTDPYPSRFEIKPLCFFSEAFFLYFIAHV